MKFEELLQIVAEEPVFETGLLLSGDRDPNDVRRQLSRWVSSGKLHQLRRGLYVLSPPYRKIVPHPFLIANRMVPGSYVSRQAALAHHGLIPEHVPVVTSVGSGRPRRWDTPLGSFDYHHVRGDLRTGFSRTEVAEDQSAFVALPEKALLDLVYLEPGADSSEYLRELRLQHLEALDLNRLEELTELFGKPKLRRAADRIAEIARSESSDYESL